MRRAFVFLGIAALLAACSREQVSPGPAPQAAISQEGCIEQFVQEYEDRTEDAAPPPASGICFDGTPAEGPPKFPTSTRRVRLEYDRGDYFAVQERAVWTLSNEPDLQRHCVVATLERSKVVKLVQGGKTESTLTRGGNTLRSADTQEQYGSTIDLGAGPTEMPPAGNTAATFVREDSPYGACLRGASPGTSMCSLEQPRACKSAKVILPIDMSFPNAVGGTQVGRTTSLERARVDKATWVLP